MTAMAPEQAEAAYSERMLLLSALDALVREVSTIRNITRIEAQTLIDKSPASAECPAKDAGPRAGR
jgi:RNA polymerase-interacting CarD/CdnL/TRCF family regulator